MAMVTQNVCRMNSLRGIMMRFSSTSASDRGIKKSVFISQSKDVFTNLALENWLYRNFDFTKHHVLLISQNESAVTIGKSQNPWHEVNIPELQYVSENGVKVARRPIDEKAVYHDEGNLNLTFFTSRNDNNKNYNLQIIRRALFREFDIKTDKLIPGLNKNKELFNSSAMSGEHNSYHHCNVLVNVNEANIKKTLLNYQNEISNTTSPKVRNLNEANKRVTLQSTIKAIGWEYLRTTPLRLIDGGKELANKQKGFQMINPTEKWFPGIMEIKTNLESWDWCYGQTPEFSISRTFPVPQYLLSSYDSASEDLKVTVLVQRGRIADVTLYVPHGLSPNGVTGETNVITTLKGQKFSEEALNTLQGLLGGLINEKEKFVTDCVKQAMFSA